MKKAPALLIAAILLATPHLKANDTLASEAERKKDAFIYGNMCISLLDAQLTLNFEHELFADSKRTYNLSAGFGASGGWSHSGRVFTLQFHAIRGKTANRFESVCGLGYYSPPAGLLTNSAIQPYLYFGYRRHKPGGTFLFRAGLGYPNGLLLFLAGAGYKPFVYLSPYLSFGFAL